MPIPVCIPVIPRNAKEYINAVVDRNWVSSVCLDEEVNFIRKLEEGFGAYVGVQHGIATTSGTTALDLAIATLGICPGDEVIVPTFTMVGTALGVIHSGARPVFVDSDPDTWCIDVNLIEAAITDRTRAVLPVHIYGYPVDMDPLRALARARGLYVIEDAAEAIGTEYKGQKAGSMSDIACFSFYANKTVTSGEGGILVTNSDDHAKRATMLKDMAFGSTRFIHEDIGYNFRMNNLTAAYAFASFEEVEENVAKRIRNASLYAAALADIEGIQLPPVSTTECKNSYWMYGILIDEEKFGCSRDETRQFLKQEHGVDTRDFFYPMHKQPIMVERGYADPTTVMPVSERLWESGFYLPSSSNLREDQIAFIADALRKLHK
ncbi:MAG: hypothetical protein AUJ92_19760 [Armatimonadetes bacterium CG2_30_59_28]|nr:DegT/DnrJ/EryC1/StrS family aminotransferase [Armatimonadota bacterium]OIO90049.1 MAG: hypothetical protein AUJ92_19760 [Armatimonadetes bacterium CG2_30_59_28]PIU60513.1 MAG: hypothetical protein COS85_24065 [Armatimonadetes bacterium CG07_land_8_20_14_0_80_59_28]PIX43252.1 MAG: hypothetical protein COZ56_07635 [Armatimonadetes bacterium CG_4_8_14_3_um_filter_58_9]PIY47754.1 MAG: hypothetical protein COZ05_04635 [Armatimonadetes bacterium CG_4_10_14_3_um_filter_59_10]